MDEKPTAKYLEGYAKVALQKILRPCMHVEVGIYINVD